MSQRVDILGVPFDAVSYDDALNFVSAAIAEKRQVQITTPNPEMLVLGQKNSAYLKVLQNADLSIPDGTGILWAATYLHKKVSLLGSLFRILFSPQSIRTVLPQRVTGVDLFTKIVERSASEKWRIFLLGAAPGVASQAIKNLKLKAPHAEFVGTFAGSPQPSHELELCERIAATSPDILFVAYGNPRQEQWIARNLKNLPSVRVAIGVGGAFDFAAGVTKRAPAFFQRLGLEWCWRLLHQPRRFGRIWRATFVFIRMVQKSRSHLA